MPVVSIILPCYNAAPYLMDAVESIKKQTVSDWEICAVDDGSRDDTREILADYARALGDRFRWFTHGRGAHKGGGASRNVALRHAARILCRVYRS